MTDGFPTDRGEAAGDRETGSADDEAPLPAESPGTGTEVEPSEPDDASERYDVLPDDDAPLLAESPGTDTEVEPSEPDDASERWDVLPNDERSSWWPAWADEEPATISEARSDAGPEAEFDTQPGGDGATPSSSAPSLTGPSSVGGRPDEPSPPTSEIGPSWVEEFEVGAWDPTWAEPEDLDTFRDIPSSEERSVHPEPFMPARATEEAVDPVRVSAVAEVSDPPSGGMAAEVVDEPGVAPSSQRMSRAARSAIEWVAVIVGALVVALVVKVYLVQAFYIPSGSMLPTLELGDRVLVNKLDDGIDGLERGDVIVFDRPGGPAADGISELIKRIVGLPGDTLEERDGEVYVNGVRLDEDYLDEGTATTNLPRTTVEEGRVFVMGDNRTASDDSRRFGTIPEEDIVGRAFVIIWPPSEAGTL